jgi:rRNA maturation protein Nop10
MMMEKFAALKKAKEDDPLPDGYWGAGNPKCPHCGEVCDISASDWYDLYEEGEHEKTCPHCGEEFRVRSQASYSFFTDEQDEDDDEDVA